MIKGLVPTRIVREKWWETPEIEDIEELRPKPKRDILLVVGDATGVLDDLSNFLDLVEQSGTPFDTLCINYSTEVVPWPVQHWIAGDSHMPDMQAIAVKLEGKDVIRHCWNPNSKGFDVRWIRNGRPGWNGTTANLGIKVGIALGYTRIVLAGVPMDNTGNWYTPHIPKNDIKQGKDHRSHLWKWTEIASRPIARLMRSLSGNTADLLGKPTVKWLKKELEHAQEEDNQETGASGKNVKGAVKAGAATAC